MENHQRKFSNSFNIDDTSCNHYMSSDFALYKREFKRNEMLNIECNQERMVKKHGIIFTE